MQQEEDDRKLALILKDYIKLVHLSSPPKFEDNKGIITKSGIIRMIEWCKQDIHEVQYALDGNENDFNEAEKQLILKEIHKIII